MSSKVDYLLLSTLCIILYITDAMLTAMAIDAGYAAEANPLLGWFAERTNIVWVLAIRTVLGILGISFLGEVADSPRYADRLSQNPQRLVRLARTGIWVILGAYTLVNIYHALGWILVR